MFVVPKCLIPTREEHVVLPEYAHLCPELVWEGVVTWLRTMASLVPINTAPATPPSFRRGRQNAAMHVPHLKRSPQTGKIRKNAREHTVHLHGGWADCSASDNMRGKAQMPLLEDVGDHRCAGVWPST
jgi:hypothetical protein